MTFSHDTFLSPLTWRYGGSKMRHLWSETHRRRLMRRGWVALAEAQHEAGLVSEEQLDDLRTHVDDVDSQEENVDVYSYTPAVSQRMQPSLFHSVIWSAMAAI